MSFICKSVWRDYEPNSHTGVFFHFAGLANLELRRGGGGCMPCEEVEVCKLLGGPDERRGAPQTVNIHIISMGVFFVCFECFVYE